MNYNFEENFITYKNDKVKLTKKEIDVLEKYGVPYKSLTITRLLTTLDELCNEFEEDDLEVVTEEIAARNYYDNTRK